MTVGFSDEEIDKLRRFIGYGRLDADVWFLGMEEAGGGVDNLRRRLAFDPVEDLKVACVEKLGITKHHLGSRVLQPTWNPMCEVMLRIDGKPTDVDSKKDYQAEHLGRRGSAGHTLLLELMPLAKPSIKAWPYVGHLRRFPDPKTYYKIEKPKRVKLIQGLVAQHRPKLIVAYGKGYWPDYKQIAPALEYKRDTVSPVFEVARGATSVILTPQLASRAMNGQTPRLAVLTKQILESS
jgi:hypothetical protein